MKANRQLSDSLLLDPEGMLELARKFLRQGDNEFLDELRIALWTHITECLSVFGQIGGLTSRSFYKMLQWGRLEGKEIWHAFPLWNTEGEWSISLCGVKIDTIVTPLEEIPSDEDPRLCKRCSQLFLSNLPQEIRDFQVRFTPGKAPLRSEWVLKKWANLRSLRVAGGNIPIEEEMARRLGLVKKKKG